MSERDPGVVVCTGMNYVYCCRHVESGVFHGSEGTTPGSSHKTVIMFDYEPDAVTRKDYLNRLAGSAKWEVVQMTFVNPEE